MRMFCSKDCPDLCEFDIELRDSKPVLTPAPANGGRNGFVCSKLKDFYDMENANGLEFEKESLNKAAELIRANAGNKFLYIRGSGSLSYGMSYWDVLFSQIEGAVFIEGGPCDNTGCDAHELDFGVCANPPVENLEQTENIILFGKNCRAASQHFYAYMKKLKQEGKKILYLDPVRSETVMLADDFIQIHPSADGLLCEAWLRKSEGADDWRTLLEHTGITEEQFLLFDSYIKHGKTGFVQGYGLQRYKNGMAAVRWINRLAVRTGNEKNLYFGRSSKAGLKTLQAAASEYVNISKLPAALEDFPLIIIAGANPAVTYPGTNLWHELLGRKMLICIDVAMTETAKHSDVFIKVGGMFSQTDAMSSYFFDIEPSFREKFTKSVSDSEAARKLGKLLGIEIKLTAPENIERSEVPQRVYSEKPLSSAWFHEKEGYRLLSGSHPAYLNSQVPERLGENISLVYMSDEAASENRLKDGDIVSVYNSLGSFDGVVRISRNVQGKTLFAYKSRKMSKGWLNMVTFSDPTDSYTAPAYYDTFVNIKKA
jgi:anaerobic selenocysteine-containing dehydrogenase